MATHHVIRPLSKGKAITPERLERACMTSGEIPQDIFAHWIALGVNAYTYFARGLETGRIKIGKSRSPWQRVVDLRYSSYGEKAQLVLVMRGQHLEVAFHRRFAAHCDGGEWFFPHADILDFLTARKKRWEIGATLPHHDTTDAKEPRNG